eukprot:12912499-Prorocentrum_lima.AAC.1
MSPSSARGGALGEAEEDVVILPDELLMTSRSSTSTHQTGQALPKVQFRQMTEMVLDASVVE